MHSAIIKHSELPNYAHFTQLYPHAYEQFVFVVPNRIAIKLQHFNLFEAIIFANIWLIPIIIYTILRYYNQQIPFRHLGTKYFNWFDMCFNSFQMTIFGIANIINVRNKVESVLVIFLSIFSLLASILFSGYLFQLYSSSSTYSEINSIADLKRSGLDVYYPMDLMDPNREVWLRKKYVFFII